MKTEADEIKKYGNYVLFNSSFKLRPSKKLIIEKTLSPVRENLKTKIILKRVLIRGEQLYLVEHKNYDHTIDLLKDLAHQNPKKILFTDLIQVKILM